MMKYPAIHTTLPGLDVYLDRERQDPRTEP
jgi:hypothetical protein